MLRWTAIQRHTRSTSMVNFLPFHPSFTNLFTPEYHRTPFWNCQLHIEIDQAWTGNSPVQTPDQDKIPLVSLWMGGVSHPIVDVFTLPHCPGALKHYFCNNKDHVRGKSHGRTTTLSLALRPFLTENAACALLASHRVWSHPCTVNIKWQELHELCQHSCYQPLSTRADFGLS